jgi:hypothetical protein
VVCDAYGDGADPEGGRRRRDVHVEHLAARDHVALALGKGREDASCPVPAARRRLGSSRVTASRRVARRRTLAAWLRAMPKSHPANSSLVPSKVAIFSAATSQAVDAMSSGLSSPDHRDCSQTNRRLA